MICSFSLFLITNSSANFPPLSPKGCYWNLPFVVWKVLYSCFSYSLQRWYSKASAFLVFPFDHDWRQYWRHLWHAHQVRTFFINHHHSLQRIPLRCALISKTAGGIGLNIHKIRAVGSYIAGTNGVSNGIVPMLRVFNNTARYVDQGGNKRPGAFAIYLEPWHADIFAFLDLKKNTGKEENRARDLFYALWVGSCFVI